MSGASRDAAEPRGGRGALELRGPASALLDEPLALTVRGLGGESADWRARLRDDDGRVWRAAAADPLALAQAWTPGADASGRAAAAIAALQSLRPLTFDVRAEAADGRAAARSFTRLLQAEGVRVRRWRDPLPATLFLPAERRSPGAARPDAAESAAERRSPAALLIDATGATAGSAPTLVAPLAAALLASRGVLTLVVPPGRGDAGAAVPLLAQVARGDVEVVEPPLPPGIPGLAQADAAAWDALLARLGALARTGAGQATAGPEGAGGSGASDADDSAASSARRPSGESS